MYNDSLRAHTAVSTYDDSLRAHTAMSMYDDSLRAHTAISMYDDSLRAHTHMTMHATWCPQGTYVHRTANYTYFQWCSLILAILQLTICLCAVGLIWNIQLTMHMGDGSLRNHTGSYQYLVGNGNNTYFSKHHIACPNKFTEESWVQIVRHFWPICFYIRTKLSSYRNF